MATQQDLPNNLPRKRKPCLAVARRSTSTIGRLDKPLRDEVNRFLLSGAPYREIVPKLAALGVRVTARQLSTWRLRHHQDWLKEQQRFDHMRSIRDFTMQLVSDNAGGTIQEAGLLVAASQVYEALSDFDLNTLKEQLADNPEFYTRLVTALSRLGDGSIKFERYRADVAAAKAKLESTLAEAKATGFTDGAVANLQAILKLL